MPYDRFVSAHILDVLGNIKLLFDTPLPYFLLSTLPFKKRKNLIFSDIVPNFEIITKLLYLYLEIMTNVRLI